MNCYNHCIQTIIILVLVFVAIFTPEVDGGGRLLEPPSRSSLWRHGIHGVEINVNDASLNCGGFKNQWILHGGKCGICGDAWQSKRDNEAGGRYAKGLLQRSYSVGEVINVTIQLTENRSGWFEFRLCLNNDVTEVITNQCLNENLLAIESPANKSSTKHTQTRYRINDSKQELYNLRVQLPRDLSCSQCVLQWKYNTGNRWGYNDNGFGCIGCGRQEQFYGCSDIKILPKQRNTNNYMIRKYEKSTKLNGNILIAWLLNIIKPNIIISQIWSN